MQLISIQNELQKQMTVMVAVPVAKEGKRMESKSPSILLFGCHECSERIEMTVLLISVSKIKIHHYLRSPNFIYPPYNVIRWSLKDGEVSMATWKKSGACE